MKKISLACCFLLSLIAHVSFAQTAYQVAGNYHFDRELIQVLSGRKNATDSCRIHSYFTNSGEYAAVRLQDKMAKHSGWVIATRNGNLIFFNDQEKTATILSIQKILSDLTNLVKWIKMDSLMANMHRHVNGKEPNAIKTGNIKSISGYTANEFAITDSSGRKSKVWVAKVDFPVPIDYILGAGGGKWLPMINSKLQSHPLMQALITPGSLITEVQLTDSLGKTHQILQTEDILKGSTDFPTAGYTVLDYSNYTLMEVFEAEMRRHMN